MNKEQAAIHYLRTMQIEDHNLVNKLYFIAVVAETNQNVTKALSESVARNHQRYV